MPSDKFPTPESDDDEIQPEANDIINELLGSSSEHKKLPVEYISFPKGSIEELVCNTICLEFLDSIYLKREEEEPWKEGLDMKAIYELPEDPKERTLFREVLEDEVIKFLKMNILNEDVRAYGLALENEAKLNRGATDEIYNSVNNYDHQLDIILGEIIGDTIERIIFK